MHVGDLRGLPGIRSDNVLKESISDFKGRVTMQFTMKGHRAYAAPALGLMLVTAVFASACSSGSSSSSSSASSPATAASSGPSSSAPAASGSSSGAVSQITANWNKFFASSTPTSEREQLLENGTQFAPALSALGSIPVSSKVDSVTVNSATTATVKYDLTALGQTVASGQSGSAVLQDGTWKVGDNVLCGLLTEGKAAGMVSSVPSVCSSAS